MGQLTFDAMLHLVSIGFTVRFNKAQEFAPRQVLRVEMYKNDCHHMRYVDMSLQTGLSTDHLIAKALEIAESEFENDFENVGGEK